MEAILNLLSGKKTYLVSGVGILIVGLWLFGVVEQAMAEKLLTLVGLSGAITLRAAITKTQVQAEAAVQQVAALHRSGRSMIG